MIGEDALMERVFHKQLSLESLLAKTFQVYFSGGRITFDGGGLLLQEVDLPYGLTQGIDGSLHDPRDPKKVTHGMTRVKAKVDYGFNPRGMPVCSSHPMAL